MRVDEAAKDFEFRGDPWGPDGATDVDQLMSPTGNLAAIEASGTAIFTREGWLDAATVNGALPFSDPIGRLRERTQSLSFRVRWLS